MDWVIEVRMWWCPFKVGNLAVFILEILKLKARGL